MSEQMTESTEQQAAMPANDVREDAADVTANGAAVSAAEVAEESAEERAAKLEASLDELDEKIAKETADHRRRLKNLRGKRRALGQALDAARIAAENERLRTELERIRRAGSGA